MKATRAKRLKEPDEFGRPITRIFMGKVNKNFTGAFARVDLSE